MNNRIKNYLAYKPQHKESPFLFWPGRIYYTFQQDYYERAVKPRIYEPGHSCSLADIEQYLFRDIETYLTDVEPDQKPAARHIKSFQNGRHSHNLLATKTFCKAMAYRYEESKKKEYLTLLCQGADYLLAHQCSCGCGLYLYQLGTGLPQDEGPVTAGVIQVLCEAYRFTKDSKYLREAVLAGQSAHKYLYDPSLGYRHTLGYEVETTNVNSSFAHAFAMLYSLTGEQIWKERAYLGVDKVLEMQNEEGMFWYTNKRRTIFISLYHYMVVNALLQVCDLCGMKNSRVEDCIRKAIVYGKSLVDDNGYIAEPDRPEIYSDFHSCTRGALMFSLTKDACADKIIDGFGSFFHDQTACTTIGQDGKLSDGSYWYRRERHLIDAYCDVAQIMLVQSESLL